MWETANISKAIEEFLSVDITVPEKAYPYLPIIMEETPAIKGKFPSADSPTGKKVTKTFKAYSQFYRDHTIWELTQDRFIRNNFGPQLFNDCFVACTEHCDAFEKDDLTSLTLHSWSTVNFCMAIMSTLTSLYILLAGEEATNQEARVYCYQKAEGGSKHTAELFNILGEILAQICGELRAKTQSDVLSLVVTSLVGFGSPKLFNIVIDFAKGESPFQLLKKTSETYKKIKTCESRALYNTEWIRKEYISKL